MGNESAIIIPIPEAEPIVGPLRLQYDGAARLGVPAHITVLYPFYPIQAAIGEIEVLRDVCRSIGNCLFASGQIRSIRANHKDVRATVA
jgi:hypothetical protein